jgi:uncharacterized protein (DUF4415 family)
MNATISKIELPKFSSEAEEAAWYPAHPEYFEALYAQAEAEGRLVKGPVVKRSDMTTPITLRLSQGDLAKARQQAGKKGIGYQTYMKMLLHEALAATEPDVSEPSVSHKKARRTPQEKKRLSLQNDRRNVWGNNQKAARTSIPKSKQLGNRSARHAADSSLNMSAGPFDEAAADRCGGCHKERSTQAKRKPV